MSSYADNFIYIPPAFDRRTDRQSIGINNLAVYKYLGANTVKWEFDGTKCKYYGKVSWWSNSLGKHGSYFALNDSTYKIKLSAKCIRIKTLVKPQKKVLKWKEGSVNWQDVTLHIVKNKVTIDIKGKELLSYQYNNVVSGETDVTFSSGILKFDTVTIATQPINKSVSFVVDDPVHKYYEVMFQKVASDMLQIIKYTYKYYRIVIEHASLLDQTSYDISWVDVKDDEKINKHVIIKPSLKEVNLVQYKVLDSYNKHSQMEIVDEMENLLSFSDFPVTHEAGFLSKAMDPVSEESKYYSQIVEKAKSMFY